jgi:hypothetical protein
VEESILTSTKKLIGMAGDYTAFDLDIITHINAAFSTLNQLGLGPTGGFSIEDDKAEWAETDIPDDQLGLVKTYIVAKVRLGFDPPANSFGIDALKAQIAEYEWRLNFFRELALDDEVVP